MLATPKLLITDDDAALRESLALALSRRGFQVEMAADGREGLDLAKTPSIHLAIVDYQMPRLSGLEMLAELRRIRPELPCILMSGALDEEVTAEARKMRVYSVLGKPLRLRDMDVEIRKALGDVYGWTGLEHSP